MSPLARCRWCMWASCKDDGHNDAYCTHGHEATYEKQRTPTRRRVRALRRWIAKHGMKVRAGAYGRR